MSLGPASCPFFQGITLAGLAFLIALSTATEAQVAQLSATSLTFSGQIVGTTSVSETVTLTNTDRMAPLGIDAIAASGDFHVTDDCGGTVEPQGECTISVTFSPSIAGSVSGALTMNDSAPGSPQLITLSGIGFTPRALPTATSQPKVSSAEAAAVSDAQAVAVSDAQVTRTMDELTTNLQTTGPDVVPPKPRAMPIFRQAAVSIDAQSPALATVNKDIFGANLTASMNLSNTFSGYSTMMSAFQNANFGMVRWPMALLSDYYHWQSNSFSSCAAVWGPVSHTTFDQFVQQVAQPLGLDVNITVNYGSNASCSGGGDPNEAAAWVDHANNQMHYGIKHWSIGNEQYYGSPILGSTPTTPDFNVSSTDPGSVGSATYANLVATQFYPLMKAKDSSIQIGVDLVVPDNNVSSRTVPWDSTVLANAQFDFVEVHWYGASPPNVAINDSDLLTSGVSYFASSLVQLQSELAAVGKANTPIYVGEWGIPGPNGGSPQSISIVGALYTALVLGELTKGGIGMAGVWEGFDSGPCEPSPPGDYSWQTWFTSSLFEAIQGGTNPACPSVVQPPFGTPFPRANAIQVVQAAFKAGDTVFAPTVNALPEAVKAYGTRRGSGYGMLLINTDENATVVTTVSIANDVRIFNASSLVYGKAQYDESQNNVWTSPVPQSLGQVTGSFYVVLPQWSITSITLSAAP